jgi:hypothetical protein
MREFLGHTMQDSISGFTGVAIGHCVYLTGCNQTLLQPRCEKSETKPEGQWFDDQRLKVMPDAPIVLDNSGTNGCDQEAPKR